jgi:hypothetical protein
MGAEPLPVQPPPDLCPGCGAPTTGNFCANCGQRTRGPVLSLRELLRDVLEDQLGLSSTLPRTLRALFIKPGFLTNEYLQLRLSPYVPPFRLYVAVSVLFFLVVGLRARPFQLTEAQRAAAAAQRNRSAASPTGAPRTGPGFGIFIDPTRADWADHIVVRLGSERLDRAVRNRLVTLRDLPGDQALTQLFKSLLQNAPKMMFVMLPLYALLLKLLYLRRRRTYVEHAVFALHVHAFFFSLFLAWALLPSGLQLVQGVLAMMMVIYSWLAQKRVYRQGRVMTTAKWLVLHAVYGMAVLSGITVAMLASASAG